MYFPCLLGQLWAEAAAWGHPTPFVELEAERNVAQTHQLQQVPSHPHFDLDLAAECALTLIQKDVLSHLK